MKERCKANILQQYGYSGINKILDIATFLNPRFKHYKDDDQKKKEIDTHKVGNTAYNWYC